MLLDEPSMGLAPILVQIIFEIIYNINQQGTTILLVEQKRMPPSNWRTAAMCYRRGKLS